MSLSSTNDITSRCEESFEEYLQKFSAKSRQTLAQKVRAFAKHSGGEVHWREYRDPEDLKEFYRLARGLARKTYQERLLGAALPDGDEFQREMLARAIDQSVRGYLLFFGGAPVAYIYCPIRDGVLLYEYVGFDPEQARLSPGIVLQYLVLERLFAEGGHRIFDFTEGEGAHKEFFATGSARCADIYYFRRSGRNLCLVGLHLVLASVSRTVATVLEWTGFKSRVKSLFRARARASSDGGRLEGQA